MSRRTSPVDVVIVGGGHNGLVAAAYLARAGRHVILLEASHQLGGAAVSEELAPGYVAPTGAHILDAWPRAIERDLRLRKRGLRPAVRAVPTVALDTGGRHIMLRGPRRQRQSSLAAWSPQDAEAYAKFQKELARQANLLRTIVQHPLPKAGHGKSWAQRGRDAGLQGRASLFGRHRLRRLLQSLPSSLADEIDGRFSTDLLKGALGLEAVCGQAISPRDPGSFFQLIYREAMRAGHRQTYPKGGMGALSRALVSAAQGYGAQLREHAPVEKILIEEGRAVGVCLQDGTEIYAHAVLSTINVKQSVQGLLGPTHLDAGLATRVTQIRQTGTVAKVNLALDGLPAFRPFRQGSPLIHGSRLLIAPDLRAFDAAFSTFKRGEPGATPLMELVIPSVHDPLLCPAGQHVMSVLVHYVPYRITGGWDDAAKDRLLNTVVETLGLYAPDIESRIVAADALTPHDIESRFGLPEGDWAHGQMAPDQLFQFRPAPGLAHYETPVDGLYLGGAGTHPGGGLTGLPGKFAAQAILSKGRAS